VFPPEQAGCGVPTRASRVWCSHQSKQGAVFPPEQAGCGVPTRASRVRYSHQSKQGAVFPPEQAGCGVPQQNKQGAVFPLEQAGCKGSKSRANVNPQTQTLNRTRARTNREQKRASKFITERDVRATRALVAIELQELREGSQSEPVGSPLSDVRASRALVAVELQEEPSVLGIRELLSHSRIPLRTKEKRQEERSGIDVCTGEDHW
jgi:hypothetical protein